MARIDAKNGCIGCSACYAACPTAAIRMRADERGFYVAALDAAKCVDCGRCAATCPLMDGQGAARSVENLSCQYLYALDEAERVRSTSGGVFYLLAREALRKGGLVCGCVWQEGFVARHVCTGDPEIVKAMRGSKYVQSDVGDCFLQIKAALAQGRSVLFCGTPCQTTALKRYLGADQGQLLTCALICGGVPSPLVWRKYKEALETRSGARITALEMRSKDRKWLISGITASLSNGRTMREVLHTQNLYGTNFGLGLTIADICMRCPFQLDRVAADLVIGDHWGIDAAMLRGSGNKGATVAIPLSAAGEEALAAIAPYARVAEGRIDKTIESHAVLTKDHVANPNRAAFFDALARGEDILRLLQRYYDAAHPATPARRAIARALYATGLYVPLVTMRWRITHRRA